VSPGWVEAAWAGGLWLVALASRAAVQTWLPTVPVSDFRSVLDLAAAFTQPRSASTEVLWDLLNPGVPMLLAPCLAWLPASPEAVARWVSVLLSSSLCLLPLLLWRGVLPNRVRRLAGCLLALWPGSVLTAGLLSQDNWALLPTVALAVLAVRALTWQRTGLGRRAVAGQCPASQASANPILVAGLWGLGVAMRQELALALLPFAVPAAIGWPPRMREWRRIVVAAAAAAAILVGLAMLRQHATGRFGLTTRHVGAGLLGAFMPGVGSDAWGNPAVHLAAVEPEALATPARTEEASLRLAVAEARRRPFFHAARIVGTTLGSLAGSDGGNVYWSLAHPGAVPPGRGEVAGRVFRAVTPLLLVGNITVHALFLVGLAVGVRARAWELSGFAFAILLKVAIHVAIVSQGRYFVFVTAVELLAIAVAAGVAADLRPSRRLIAPVLAGLATVVTLAGLGRWSHAAFLAGIEDPPRSYTFTVFSARREATLTCRMQVGRLSDLNVKQATIRPFPRDPAPGDTATAFCRARHVRGTGQLVIRVLDAYPQGGLPGRIVQRVRAGDRVLWEHDIAAEPGTGWGEVAIPGSTGPDPPEVTIEVAAVRPDPGCAWGPAAATAIRLESVPASPIARP
jgi:hypothetical protein